MPVEDKDIKMADDNAAIKTAIEALGKIATDNELLGYGHLPTVPMRVQAALSLGNYMPHPDAIRYLIEITKQDWAPKEVREAATLSLGRRN